MKGQGQSELNSNMSSSDFGNFDNFDDFNDFDDFDDFQGPSSKSSASSPPSKQPSMDPPPVPPLPPPTSIDDNRTPTSHAMTAAQVQATIVALPPPIIKKETNQKNRSEIQFENNENEPKQNQAKNDENEPISDNSKHNDNDNKDNEMSVEEAAALLGACITRLSNQSVYRTTTPPNGMHSAFSAVKPVPCSELYHRLASLYSILKKYTENNDNDSNSVYNDNHNTLAAAPSIIPLLHKLLYISSSLALTPIYLHSSQNTVPQQPLPQQLMNAAVAVHAGNNHTNNVINVVNSTVVNRVNSSDSATSSSSSTNVAGTTTNYSNATTSNSTSSPTNNIKKQTQGTVTVPPIRITPPLASKPIRYLWVQCITLAHRLSPPPITSTTAISNATNSSSISSNSNNNSNSNMNSNSNNSPSTSTNILAPYLSYATSHPKSAKSSGGTRVSSLSVLQHIFQDDVLSKRFFFHKQQNNPYNNNSNSYSNSSSSSMDHNQLLLNELLTTCFNGLKSSGYNDVHHRIHSIKCLISVFLAYRNNILFHKPYTNNNNTIHWNDMEERTIQEAIKVLKKAADDKYSEVRLLATQFASVLSTILIHEKYQYISSSSFSTSATSNANTNPIGGGSHGLTYLDDVCLLCYRNLDDESIRVSIGWSMALARCMSVAIEYHSFINQQLSSSASSSAHHHNSTSPTNNGIDSPTSSNNNNYNNNNTTAAAESSFHQFTSNMTNTGNDLASKFKAFNETRRTLNSIASNSCITIQLAFQFLVSQFIKVGNNAVSSGGGGSGGGSAIGIGMGIGSLQNSGVGSGDIKGHVIDSSRYIRNGIGNTLVQLCQLQINIGAINIGVESSISGGVSNVTSKVNILDPSYLIMNILLNMVGPAFDYQIVTYESKFSSSNGGSVGDTNNVGMTGKSPNPKRKIVEKSASAVGSFFGGGGGGTSNANSSVIGSGSRSNKKVVCSSSVAGMARLIVGRILRRGLSEMMSETMQLSLLRDFASMIASSDRKWNKHQRQVALVEISHLVSTLGEACASGLDELVPSLQQCLAHSDHGVRYEAAVAFQAVTLAFPSAGRKYIMSMVDEIQVHHDEILALVNNREILSMSSSESMAEDSNSSPTKGNRRFRRKQEKMPSKSFPSSSQLSASIQIAYEKSIEHQYALHGNSLVLSLVLHVMPKLPGGLPSELLDIIIAVADNLISSQGNGLLSQTQPGAIVTCVSAGYRIVSGALTMGIKPTLMHIQSIFGIWAKSATFIDGDLTRMGPLHDIRCLEPFLNSIVVFLSVSSELLLSVPDALNRTTQILEKVLPIVMGYSQLETEDNSLSMSTSLDSAKAAIMESFAWLPPGSFPLVADSVFSFASHQIKVGTESGIPSGLLIDLVAREDDLLEVRSSTRAQLLNQSGDDRMINDTICTLTTEYVDHSQREAVLHFLEEPSVTQSTATTPIKDLLIASECHDGLPTPLHQVGTWRKPPSPSKSAKERLMNAAVHVFAATFGLQGAHQQITSIHTMEVLIQSGSSGTIDINIAATLLSCLKAIPSFEGSDGVITGTSPPWMSRSTRLFFQLLQSNHSLVRRAASEGLGLLASVGVKEDIHTLDSSIILTLEQMLKVPGNESAMQQKQVFDSALPKNGGCLLAFGSIHRTLSAVLMNDQTKQAQKLPTTTMLTRLLPYIAIHTTEDDSLLTRTYALQSFSMILSHSKIVENSVTDPEVCIQILSKSVEVVENNFFGAWKSNSSELDMKTYEVSVYAFFSFVKLFRMTLVLIIMICFIIFPHRWKS